MVPRPMAAQMAMGSFLRSRPEPDFPGLTSLVYIWSQASADVLLAVGKHFPWLYELLPQKGFAGINCY